ncbi:hypothetical protein [Roseibium sp.]|uniref:hypothetical protein n=1 Tax=Roseibium sp. TaxID=1936156 RepID=UPI003D11FD93
MDSTLARIALHQFLNTMINTQQSSFKISGMVFTNSFNSFLLCNAYHLKDQPNLVEKLHVMLDPNHAAYIVQKRIDPQRDNWVEIGKKGDELHRDVLATLNALNRTWRTDVVPFSVLRSFSATWKSAVIEAVIWNRGTPRVRSTAQAGIYQMSRCDLHNRKARAYKLKQNKRTLYDIYNGMSAA